MIFAIAVGILSAIAVLIVMARLDLKKFMGYPALTDVGVTLILSIFLYGTYVGVVAAIIGGLFFSALVSIIRRVYGYKRLERKGVKLVWVEYPATWVAKSKATINHYTSTIGETKCLNLKLSTPLIACIAGVLILACVL